MDPPTRWGAKASATLPYRRGFVKRVDKFGAAAAANYLRGRYVALLLLTAVCAATVWHSKPVVDEGARPVESGEALSWGRRARWVALAFVPSSLLLAVTSYISTDVASVPLLWVVPLSLYLLTFVLAFSPSAGKVRALALRLMPLALLVLVLVLVRADERSDVVRDPRSSDHVLDHVALFCHGELAQDRPSPARLTEFYFWIALGGMLGGLFNALVARVFFVGIAEYPLVLFLAALLRARSAPRRWRQRPGAGLDHRHRRGRRAAAAPRGTGPADTRQCRRRVPAPPAH